MHSNDKGINCPVNCVLCSGAEVDNMDVFFTCPSSQNVWNMCEFQSIVQVASVIEENAATVIFNVLANF
ncbi:hypothetical protein A2U01_0059780 [Trifolium medium]|uniref:Uncharacterized protein n=1 Tax=Trifolium medium TaxID=97028 RepID=A0A392RQS2_9FABA|nr:hypothetical protein [Trifolium medium]